MWPLNKDLGPSSIAVPSSRASGRLVCNNTSCLLELVGVVLSRLAEEGGVGVGRVLPLRPLYSALLRRSGGGLLSRPLDSLLQHAHVFLRQLREEKGQQVSNLERMKAFIWVGRFFRLNSASYVSNELVDLVAAHVVHGHHGVEGGVSDRRVSVADVNCDVLEGFGRSRLANIHPVAFNQAAQLFQAF